MPRAMPWYTTFTRGNRNGDFSGRCLLQAENRAFRSRAVGGPLAFSVLPVPGMCRARLSPFPCRRRSIVADVVWLLSHPRPHFRSLLPGGQPLLTREDADAEEARILDAGQKVHIVRGLRPYGSLAAQKEGSADKARNEFI